MIDDFDTRFDYITGLTPAVTHRADSSKAGKERPKILQGNIVDAQIAQTMTSSL